MEDRERCVSVKKLACCMKVKFMLVALTTFATDMWPPESCPGRWMWPSSSGLIHVFFWKNFSWWPSLQEQTEHGVHFKSKNATSCSKPFVHHNSLCRAFDFHRTIPSSFLWLAVSMAKLAWSLCRAASLCWFECSYCSSMHLDLGLIHIMMLRYHQSFLIFLINVPSSMTKLPS